MVLVLVNHRLTRLHGRRVAELLEHLRDALLRRLILSVARTLLVVVVVTLRSVARATLVLAPVGGALAPVRSAHIRGRDEHRPDDQVDQQRRWYLDLKEDQLQLLQSQATCLYKNIYKLNHKQLN